MSTQNASDAAVAGDRHGDPRPDGARHLCVRSWESRESIVTVV